MKLTRLRSGVVGDALALNGFYFHRGLGVVVLVAGVSHAQVIDFEDNAVPPGTQLTLTSDVISGGFLFDLLTNHGHLSNAGVLANNPWNTDNGGTYLVTDDFNGPNLLTMSPVAGSTFALFSIDFAEWLGTLAAGANADFPATSVEVTGFLQGGGTVQQTVIMDFINDGDGPLNDFQTELFDATWTNLTHVEFDGVGGVDSYFVIDNIAVPAAGCLAVTTQEIVCHADGTTFTVNIEGLNACTGGTTQVTFTGSGGAVGEELCFTVLVNDDGFCCSTVICVTIPDCGLGNLLANPGFETGNFDGWTINGNSVQTVVNTDGTPIPGVHEQFVPTFQNVRSGGFGANALVRTNSLEQVYLDQSVFVAPSTTYTVGYYVGVDSPNQSSYGFHSPNVILVDGIPLVLTGLGQINRGNDAVGSGPDNFRHVFGSFTTGPGQKTATVSFRITGSGTGRAGFSLDDFHFSTALPSDLDGDGIVGIVDFLALLGAWGSCSDCGTPQACPADFDGDCSVGILDLLNLLGNWG